MAHEQRSRGAPQAEGSVARDGAKGPSQGFSVTMLVVAVAIAGATAVSIATGPSRDSGAAVDTGPQRTYVPLTRERASAGDAGRVTTDRASAPFHEPVEEPLARVPSIPARLLTVGHADGALREVAIVDLERGSVATWSTRSPMALSFAAMHRHHTVLRYDDETVDVFGHDLTDLRRRYRIADLELSTMPWSAPSVAAVPALDGRHLWVVQPGIDCCGDEPRPGQAELVDLDTGVRRHRTVLSPNSHPVASLADGLVLNHHRYVEGNDGWVSEPGSHVVHVLHADGEVSALVAGEALAATAEAVLVLACESHEPRKDCDLAVVDPGDGRPAPVERPAAGDWNGVAGTSFPMYAPPWASGVHGSRVVLELVGEATGPAADPYSWVRHLVVVDTAPEAGPTAEVVHTLEAKDVSAAWDRAGDHLIVVSDEGELTIIDPEDGTTVVAHGIVPDGHWVLGIG